MVNFPEIRFRLTLLNCMGFLALVMLLVATKISTAAASEVLYANPTHGWSVRYPAEWSLNSADPSSIHFVSPGNEGMCSVLTSSVRFTSVDALAESLLSSASRTLQNSKGLTTVIVSRRHIKLQSGISGVDILVNLVPGGRSRRVFFLFGNTAIVVDCEGYAATWGRVSRAIERIIGSLNLYR
jgi:hypothetical protein